jgi:hypothetical protein
MSDRVGQNQSSIIITAIPVATRSGPQFDLTGVMICSTEINVN